MRGGVEARCFYIAKELARKNQVTVIASHEPGAVRYGQIGDVTVLRVGPARNYTHHQGLWSRFLFALSICCVRLPQRPDLIDTQAIVAYIPGYFLARRYQARAVITLHDLWLGQWVKLFGWLGLIGEIVERIYLRLGWNGVIANSQYTFDKIKNRIKCRIQVVYNGIDHEHAPVTANQPIAHSLCVVSRLVPYKRVADVLHAQALLHSRGKEVHSHIIGSGPSADSLEKLAVDLGVASLVTFHGFLPKHGDVLRQLQSCNILCHPSSVEGFGIVTLEAALVGRPYVATDIPAIREVTRDGVGGILYPVGDIEVLAKALEQLLYNETFYQQKQKELPTLLARYQWHEQAAAVDSYYQTLV